MNVKIGRWTMAIMGIVMVISTAREMSLMYINMFINCVLPPLFIPFIYAAFWKKVNKKGLTLTMFIAMVGNVILSAMVLAGTGVGANTPIFIPTWFPLSFQSSLQLSSRTTPSTMRCWARSSMCNP